MAKKNVFGDRSPTLSKVWMTGPPLSQGLDPALLDTKYHTPNAKMAARLTFFCLNLNKPN